MRTLWNEGRVVGLSAYEIFVRHILGKNPAAVVPSEQAWLASMLSNGSSMLLQVGVDNIDGSHYIEIDMPVTSELWAANTIVGSFFLGTGAGSGTTTSWCDRVTDYGPLIQNDSEHSPEGGVIPPTDKAVSISDTVRDQLREYAKIIDGIVIQPGEWTENSTKPPQKGLTPDASVPPVLRILVNDRIETPFYILLTGFSYRGILDGVMDYTAFNLNPENGDYLGPVSFPWANKIIFSVPSAVISELNNVAVDVVDLANMYLYNTKYIWPFKNPPGVGDFTKADLYDVKSLTGVQVLSGYVSDEFIDTFCVSYKEAIDADADGKISSTMQIQLKYIRQIEQLYGTAVASDSTKWMYFFYYIRDSLGVSSQDGAFWPVNMETHQVLFTTFSAPPDINTTRGFNFSGEPYTDSDVTVPYTSTDIMGTYWNQDLNPGGTTVSQHLTAPGEYVFENHPIQHLAITDYELFNQPIAGVPKPPASYGDDFIAWLSATPISKVLASTEAASIEIMDSMGIHESYRALDAESFLQYLATGRDMTQPIDADYSTATTDRYFYIYDKNTILSIKAQAAWPATPYPAYATMKASLSVADFFKPAKVYIYRSSDNVDITKQMTDPTFHLWGAETKVNKDSITALALTDEFGCLLPMNGVQGTITGDTVNWDMLMTALSQNKSVDVLNGAKVRTNYVQLGNGLRFYISATEPTDTDVPEGSVGLGWDGVKIYTSGAWV